LKSTFQVEKDLKGYCSEKLTGESVFIKHKMMLRFAKILFLVLLSQTIVAQMQVDWQQCYGGMEADVANDVAQSGNDFLVIGTVTEGGGGQITCTDEDATWLIKIDNSSNIIWQKCFFHFGGYRMQQANASSYYYITGGTISEPYPDAYNVYVGKIDTSGTFIWEKALGNQIGVSDYQHYGESTNDGGFVAIADIFSQGGDITNWYGGYDGWVVKLDSLGNTEWDFTIGTANSEFIIGITQTNDGGYLAGLTGKPDGTTGNISCTPFTSNYADAIIYKLDSIGNPEWHKCYGGSAHDGAVRLLCLNDGYLVAAWGESADGDLTGSGWHGGSDIWLIRTDLFGNIIWQKCYGGSNDEGPEKIFQTTDGGFIVFGNTRSFDGDVVGNPSLGNERSIWIFKIDNLGNLIWQQCIGGSRSENVHGVIKHSDYNYTVAGEMFYSPSGDVNCSNFIYGSSYNYWVFGISDTTVNVTENLPATDMVKIYPNPLPRGQSGANSLLNIEFPNDFSIQNTTIEIVDINGRIMLKAYPVSVTTQLDINKLNSGLYLVKIQNNNTLITKIIIIQ